MLEQTQSTTNLAGMHTVQSEVEFSLLDSARQALEQERGRLLEKIRLQDNRLAELDPATRNDPADAADQLATQSKGIAMRRLWERMLQAVERAIARIENGTYGICEHCGRSIPEERLLALPSALLCVDCAARQAKNVWAV